VVFEFTIENGRITAIGMLADPAALEEMHLQPLTEQPS
jgi:hypothetical protein